MIFNNLDWHDSLIEEIIISRLNPGINDLIQVKVIWPNGVSNTICFMDVYWVNLDLNFGIVSPESIYRAYSQGKENEIVQNLYKKWRGQISIIDLNYYEIETNSTKSKIRVVAQRFEIN